MATEIIGNAQKVWEDAPLRDARLVIKLTPEEKAALEDWARREGITLALLVRRLLYPLLPAEAGKVGPRRGRGSGSTM
jgi:hypothetical protein